MAASEAREIVVVGLRRAARAAAEVGVHLSDPRDPTRGWCDRVLPGDGVIPLPEGLAALEAGGFNGWYDLEILSDNGLFGNDYADSVWKLPPTQIVRKGRDGFLRAWAGRKAS